MIELGHGYTAKAETFDDAQVGFQVEGPAGQHCRHRTPAGRCNGLVSTNAQHSRPAWSVVTADPLTLHPSIQCDCNVLVAPGEGQHGWITDGQWVNAGGIEE